MDNELLIDMGYVLQASKRISYKENVRTQTKTFIEFLQLKELVCETIISNELPLQDDFKLFENHLTGKGVLFFDKEFIKWAGRCDRGGSPTDLPYLEKQYKKFIK